jgi:hypothetical protein
VGQRAHGIAVDRGRVEEPAFPLVPGLHLGQLAKMRAHLAYLPGELLDPFEESRVLQVPEDLVAETQGTHVVDLLVQQRRQQLTLLAVTGDRLDDLIELQVGNEGTVTSVPGAGLLRRVLEQQAAEPPRQIWRR